VQVRSFEAVSRMVQAGLGIGILPEQVAMDFHEGLGLAVRALKDPWALRQMLVCIKQGQTVGASLQRLLDTLCPANPAPDTN
jgi:DNA-binding transcriptional LysR family regulator